MEETAGARLGPSSEVTIRFGASAAYLSMKLTSLPAVATPQMSPSVEEDRSPKATGGSCPLSRPHSDFAWLGL